MKCPALVINHPQPTTCTSPCSSPAHCTRMLLQCSSTSKTVRSTACRAAGQGFTDATHHNHQGGSRSCNKNALLFGLGFSTLGLANLLTERGWWVGMGGACVDLVRGLHPGDTTSTLGAHNSVPGCDVQQC